MIIEKLKNYGLFGLIELFINLLYTKLFYRKSRLIRKPFYIRGSKNINLGNQLTTGINCRIDAFTQTGNKIINIGNNVQINDNVHIGAINNIKIGNNVLIASKVFISDHNHGSYTGAIQDTPNSSPIERKLRSKPIVIADNVWIGEFVSILQGVHIGEGSIIGTMSVVTKDIPAYSIAVGSPAKVIKKYSFDKKTWEKI